MKIQYVALLLFSLISLAQAPQGISYQAVAFNTGGSPINNTSVGVKISILQGSVTGSEVYTETHLPQTNNQGLFNLTIGQGSSQGNSFDTIDWGSGSKFIKVEVDPNGGSNYTTLGTSQLMSAPYALYAENVNTRNGNLLNQINNSKTANFAFYDFQNDVVQIFDSKSGLWEGQSVANLNSSDILSSDGSFFFYDFGNDTIYAYSLTSGSWIGQSVGGILNKRLASNRNFAVFDFSADVVYAFSNQTGQWYGQNVSNIVIDDFIASNGNFFCYDFINDMVYVFNGKTGVWTGQNVGNISDITAFNGNFALEDFTNNIALVYSKVSGAWVSQTVGNIDSEGIKASGSQ
ncbi:MAG: hypothetical protein WBG46_11200 [Nonlabens sp.]